MAWWTRIIDGVVQEPARDLPDGDEPSKYFPAELPGAWTSAPDGSAQSGWTYAGGVYTAPVVPAPTVAQQAEAALMAGLAITSTSHPAINGTFAVDPAWQGRIASVSTYILRNNKFPGGATTYPWPKLTGGVVVFPSTTAFQDWATAVADYVSALDLIALSDSGSLPPASATIA